MKTLLIALNSKFTHTALSVWYLRAACGGQVLEFSTNEPIHSIYRQIYEHKPDNICFSCYIWNIEYVLKLCEMLKKSLPSSTVILGGPEVSYNAKELAARHSFIDFIITGEGENALSELLNGNTARPGIVSRHGGNETFQLVPNLDELPSPYTEEMLAAVGKRTIYFESSRGCPFSCSYCLSSTFAGVRFFSMDRVKSELEKLRGMKIKFVDRTFNCNKARTLELLSHIILNMTDTQFHFEIAADLLDDEIINLLTQAPKGMIQLEIGVQSTNECALTAVNRVTDTNKVLENVRKLRKANNIHLHLDLIAGLPHEDYASFSASFNAVYALNPHQLQLGFLKLLKGAKMRECEGYQYADFPPYEILSGKYISADELVNLKKIEDILDRYYNSCKFINTLNYLVKNPFEFYAQLSEKICFTSPPGIEQLYNALAQVYDSSLVHNLLKFDFMLTTRFGRLPSALKPTPWDKASAFEFLKKNEPSIPAKEQYKNVHFEVFEYDVTDPSLPNRETVVMFKYGADNSHTIAIRV